MSTRGPKRDGEHESRSTNVRLPAWVWAKIDSAAKENYRAVNAEIAVRIIESLPQEERE